MPDREDFGGVNKEVGVRKRGFEGRYPEKPLYDSGLLYDSGPYKRRALDHGPRTADRRPGIGGLVMSASDREGESRYIGVYPDDPSISDEEATIIINYSSEGDKPISKLTAMLR